MRRKLSGKLASELSSHPHDCPDSPPLAPPHPTPKLPHAQDFEDVRRKLSGSGFQVVFDINGREAVEAEPILDGLAGRGGSLEQYIYCSSAGVYLKSDMMPHREEDAVDPKSRHKVRVVLCIVLRVLVIRWFRQGSFKAGARCVWCFVLCLRCVGSTGSNALVQARANQGRCKGVCCWAHLSWGRGAGESTHFCATRCQHMMPWRGPCCAMRVKPPTSTHPIKPVTAPLALD